MTLAAEPRLRDYHPYALARADLLHRLERRTEAIAAYEQALQLAGSDPERVHIHARLTALQGQLMDYYPGSRPNASTSPTSSTPSPTPTWRVTSLCPAWTVHDVVAHLTLSTRTTLTDVLRGAIRARGNWERMEADAAVERAARCQPRRADRPVPRRRLRRPSAHRLEPLDTLTDALVHGQDIAIPLGREREMPLDLAEAALNHVLKSPFYGARKRLRGTRLLPPTPIGRPARAPPSCAVPCKTCCSSRPAERPARVRSSSRSCACQGSGWVPA